VREDPSIGVDERSLDDAALEALATAHATAPPPRLRARLLRAARQDVERGRDVRRALVRWRIAGAVAATLALVLGGLLAGESERAARRQDELAALARGNAELAARLEEQGRTLAGLREALAAQASVLQVLAGPRTITATLAPPQGGRGSGRVVVDPATGEAAVVLAGLDALPAGRVYELWAIRGERAPEPAGLLPAAAPIATRGTRLERPGEVTAFAVSVEPAGGSPTPTGPIVLVGPVAG
jgi:anti-sigma-K factor RskA